MRRSPLAALTLLTLTLAATGCGAHTSLPTIAPPESARTPEGAHGADITAIAPLKIPPTLIGSAIRIDYAGLNLVGGFEGFRSCPYWDPYGHVATRGYGETDWGDTFGHRCISRAQGLANLKYLIDTRYLSPVRALHVNLSKYQIRGLASFSYNLGAGIFTGSLRYALAHRAFYTAAAIMRRYTRAGGQVLAGLVRRRNTEAALVVRAEPSETRAQRRARHVRELHADLRRHRILHRELGRKGCSSRRHHHKRLGPRCRRWFAEGDRLGRAIHRFHREGLR